MINNGREKQMEYVNDTGEWVGFKGKYVGRLINSPARRFMEKIYMGDGSSAFLNEISRLIQNKEALILDVGAGSGYMSIPVARMVSNGKVISLDVSDEMLRHLTKIAKKKNVSNRIETLKCSAYKIEIEPETIDIAMSSNVLHELRNPEQVISEMVRVLKPEGHICIIDMRDFSTHRDKDLHGPFDVDEMKALFEKKGLKEIKVYPVKHLVIAVGKK